MAISTEPGSRFLDRLRSKLAAGPLPLSGTIELTWNCNFSCVHCYLSDAHRPAAREIDAPFFEQILDGAADAGCLGVALTGGEPLLRPDFGRIYAHAVRRGFLVSVFTNASLVTDFALDLFADCPPRCVEVTLYGASEKAYRLITGRGECFKDVCLGVERLLGRGIHVLLKSVLLSPLVNEVEAMRRLASGFGLDLKLDPSVDPTLGGDTSPVVLRVDPELAVEMELASPDRLDRMTCRDRLQREYAGPGDAAPCGAGLSAFHVDPFGNLMPCLVLRRPALPIGGKKFESVWKALVGKVNRRYNHDVCRACEMRHLCNFCPGLVQLGEPAPDGMQSYHCRIARARAAASRKSKLAT